MSTNPPPMIRRREIRKYFGLKLSDEELAKWVDNGIIHPFKPNDNCRAWYYSREFAQIVNGGQAA